MPIHRQTFHPVPEKAKLDAKIAEMLAVGPRLEIEIGVPEILHQFFASRGEPVPAPIVGQGLLDTGASHTSIDVAVAAQLRLPVVDQQQNLTAGGEFTVNRYPIRLAFLSPVLPSFPLFVAATCEIANQGLIALIGRNFPVGRVLVYDGYLCQFTIAT